MKRKIFTLFIALNIIFITVPAMTFNVFAEETTYSGACGENIKWTLNTSTETLNIEGNGIMNDYGIDKDNDEIAPWRSYCSSVKKVIIGENITGIGKYAFANCIKLTNVVIPNSVTVIGYGAFYGCTGLTEVKSLSGVKQIENCAFYGCTNLTKITIPDNILSISAASFFNCDKLRYNTYDSAKYLGNDTNPYIALIKANGTSITSCEVHSNTKLIADNAFAECYDLVNISIPDNLENIGRNLFGDNENLQYTAFDNGKYIGNSGNPYLILIQAADKTITSCDIHENTKFIYHYAFGHCQKLESVTMGNNIKFIGNGAFSECIKLTDIILPESVTNIGSYAFEFCYDLTDITIGKNVASIGEEAFSVSGLTNLTIPDNVEEIGALAFRGCGSLKSMYIGKGLTHIGANLFYESGNITNVTISDSTEIGARICHMLYDNCKNLQYNIYGNAKYLGDSDNPYSVLVTAANTSIKSCNIHPDTKAIGVQAFFKCSKLTSITISDNVKIICNHAFGECDGLANITIPSNVTNIGYDVFSGCDNLTSIIIPKSVISIGHSVTAECENAVIYTKTDSYAHTYAKNNNINYALVETGDINNDGNVTQADRMILSRYLSNWDLNEDATKYIVFADINDDGKITQADRIILSRYLAGWQDYASYFE